MQTSDFCGNVVGKLGLGCMRFPKLENGEIDEAQVFDMVDLALSSGVNYFDTAHPYLAGKSEIVIGKALARHPRESFYLASKFPGHQVADSYDPAGIFEEQLEKCGVDYFDYYLLHNVYENSLPVYLDERWGIIDYFVEQRRLGRIKHLGFSTHGRIETVSQFLEERGDAFEFIQIQLNYLDWTLRNAKGMLDLTEGYGLDVVVMEPLRGGSLCALADDQIALLNDLRPGATPADWGLRWLYDFSSVKMILSGMSNMEQLQQNIATFDDPTGLNAEQRAALTGIADSMMNLVPCTACGYCVDSCPVGLAIPGFMEAANDTRFGNEFTQVMYFESFPEGKRPQDCIACGSCTRMCPQGIPIPDIMKELVAYLDRSPSWFAMSADRAAEAQALREARG